MRQLIASVAFLAVVALLFTGVQAGEKGKEVTLKGKITCAKCDLGKETKCATVIVVKEKDKDVIYYFDAKSHGANHKAPRRGVWGAARAVSPPLRRLHVAAKLFGKMRLSGGTPA